MKNLRVRLNLTIEEFKAIESLMKKSNRPNIANTIESMVKLSAKSINRDSSLVNLNDIGQVNK